MNTASGKKRFSDIMKEGNAKNIEEKETINDAMRDCLLFRNSLARK